MKHIDKLEELMREALSVYMNQPITPSLVEKIKQRSELVLTQYAFSYGLDFRDVLLTISYDKDPESINLDISTNLQSEWTDLVEIQDDASDFI